MICTPIYPLFSRDFPLIVAGLLSNNLYIKCERNSFYIVGKFAPKEERKVSG